VLKVACKELVRLAQAVVVAVSEVQLAQRALETAMMMQLDLGPFFEQLENTKFAERTALATLRDHKKEHGC